MSAFVISRRFNDEYKFEFASRKGKTIFTSLGYELKFECEADIDVFKKNVSNCVFIQQKASGGKHFFRLMMNENLFAISRKYATELMLAKGIADIKKYAVGAETLDFSGQEHVFPEVVFD
ncbi:MAG: hypothetical protein RLZZ312_357 [Bacteroidota bacterium]